MKSTLFFVIALVFLSACSPMNQFIPVSSSTNQVYDIQQTEPVKLYLSEVTAPPYREAGLIRIGIYGNDFMFAVKQARKTALERNLDCLIYKQVAVDGGEHAFYTFEFIGGKLINKE